MRFNLDRIAGARAVLIAGPTASGKSRLAGEIGEALAVHGRDAVIVNADSMQVYRELRILTARPTAEEEQSLPHRLYGTVGSATRYSIGTWMSDAAEQLLEARRNSALPILVGGTGLYFKALTEGLAAVPAIPEDVRRYWASELAEVGPAGLHEKLRKRDPAVAAEIRPTDPQRLLRALEVVEATGRSLRDWQAEAAEPLIRPGEAERIVLELDRGVLSGRISDRFEAMLRAGALEEVEALVALQLDTSLPAMKAIGVKELAAVLRNGVSLEEAAEQIKLRTRQYAKRQDTWFRNQMPDWNRLPG